MARAKRYQLPLSLLMIDVDDFKSYDDAHGHLAGDALLRALAVILLSQTRRQVDLVARYGGEEFAIILPSTDAKGGLRAGERLRDAINHGPLQRQIALPSDGPSGAGVADDGPGSARVVAERIRHTVEIETFDSTDAPPVITVSIGVAGLDAGPTTADGLVDAADRALYRAKQVGKNQVALA